MIQAQQSWKLAAAALLCALLAAAPALAGAPSIVQGGVYPASAAPGDTVRIYAQVTDPDGLDDVQAVGVIYNNQLLATLPESAVPGFYLLEFTVPETAGAASYLLQLGVVDLLDQAGPLVACQFSILPAGTPAVTLLSPLDGATFNCANPPTFAWEPYAEATLYLFEITLPSGEFLSVPLPTFITGFPVEPLAWQLLDDGTYYWRVGAMTGGGSEPAFSPYWSFTKDCSGSGDQVQLAGTVLAVHPDAATIDVQPLWSSDQGFGGEPITLQVTAGTGLWNFFGQPIDLAQIEPGNPCFAIALSPALGSEYYEALNVWVAVSSGPPPWVSVEGMIVELDPEQLTLAVATPDGVAVPVQVTDRTLIHDQWGAPLTFADLALQQHVLCVGEMAEEVLTAFEITVFGGTPPPPTEISGFIVELDAALQMLFVQATPMGPVATVQVGPQTLIHDQNGALLTFGDLAVGQRVDCLCELSGEVFLALEITVWLDTPTYVTVDGIIHELNPEQLSLTLEALGQLLPVQATEQTEIFNDQGVTLTFADLAMGDHVQVTGEYQGDILLALRILVLTR